MKYLSIVLIGLGLLNSTEAHFNGTRHRGALIGTWGYETNYYPVPISADPVSTTNVYDNPKAYFSVSCDGYEKSLGLHEVGPIGGPSGFFCISEEIIGQSDSNVVCQYSLLKKTDLKAPSWELFASCMDTVSVNVAESEKLIQWSVDTDWKLQIVNTTAYDRYRLLIYDKADPVKWPAFDWRIAAGFWAHDRNVRNFKVVKFVADWEYHDDSGVIDNWVIGDNWITRVYYNTDDNPEWVIWHNGIETPPPAWITKSEMELYHYPATEVTSDL